jgi:hypothetical protein
MKFKHLTFRRLIIDINNIFTNNPLINSLQQYIRILIHAKTIIKTSDILIHFVVSTRKIVKISEVHFIYDKNTVMSLWMTDTNDEIFIMFPL